MKSLLRVTTVGVMAAAALAAASCRPRQGAEVVEPLPPETPTVQIEPTPAPTATTAPTTAAASPGGTPINPPQAATLTAQEAGSQINLRSQPTAQSSSRGYGLVGDAVQLLQAAEGGDNLTWYYVRFQGTGAEGWVRGDFIDTSGRRPTAATPQTAPTTIVECEGVFEETVFTARYSGGSFTRIDFRNLETNATFGGSLSYQGEDAQGRPTYVGSVSPPAGGSFQARIIDLSGGSPRPGSQVALEYEGIPGSGTCR
jgi:hypothetical protein